MANLTVSKTYLNRAGYEVTVSLPALYEVCSRCEGKGTHVNPAVDGHGITSGEWEQDWDEDSREGYLTGRYDVQCEECNGLRVVPEVDESRLSKRLRVIWPAIQEQEVEAALEAARDAYTRLMENGGAPLCPADKIARY